MSFCKPQVRSRRRLGFAPRNRVLGLVYEQELAGSRTVEAVHDIPSCTYSMQGV
jgi:hypothetical protein